MRNAGKSGNFGGGALGIAARHNDFAVRVLPANAPNSSPGVLFGRRGYCAGVQNDVLGPARGVSPLHPMVPELPFNRGAVRLSGAATEIFYVKAGHATILAYIHLAVRKQSGPSATRIEVS
jgi:hypothetical protein